MNEWMRPMMESQVASTQSVEKLSQSVTQCLESYDTLISALKNDKEDLNPEE